MCLESTHYAWKEIIVLGKHSLCLVGIRCAYKALTMLGHGYWVCLINVDYDGWSLGVLKKHWLHLVVIECALKAFVMFSGY